LPSTILGTITAVGGGMMRDLLIIREPKIFQSGTLYAVAAFVGALVFALMKYFAVLPDAAAWIGLAIILALRFVSVFFHIETKPARDYSDKVEALAKRIKAKLKR
ncbi:MAG: TRIC cation channel family protein, partial [Eggerthellaceae bacterium]|nr:TRIC cation channel family protein [Eggerthellaceae bacterium]